MGASDSKETDAEILNLFTPVEHHQIKSIYSGIVGNQKTLTEPFLKKYYPKWLGENIQKILFHVMCNCDANKNGSHDNRHLSDIQFAGFLANILKGTYTEKAGIIYILCRGQNGAVPLYNLYQTICSIVRSYVIVTKSDPTSRTWKADIREDDIGRFCRGAIGVTEGQIAETDDRRKDRDDIEIWLSKSPLFLCMFHRVFWGLFPVNNVGEMPKSLMPNVTNVNWTKTTTILDILSINYINFQLPRVQQSEWRLLYSNVLHGESFSQLVRFISDKGPNILIVKDKDGHCFGAYVTDSWEIKPGFYGSPECFLFTLSPHFGVYTTTGYNENYMYLNQGQETLPNGLGLGGQLGYFGLWIDYTFNTGHSKAIPKCTTYGSPQLSAKPEFEVDTIEVWAIGPVKKLAEDSDEEEFNKTSILDKDAGAKAILELAGKKQHSDGLRDLGEEEAPMTDEMKKKMNTIPKLL